MKYPLFKLLLQCALLPTVLFLCGCGKEYTPHGYLEMAQNPKAELALSIEQGGYKSTLFHRSLDYYIAQALSINEQTGIAAVTEQYENGNYFVIHIEPADSTGYAYQKLFGPSFQGDQKMNLLFNLKDHLFLVDGELELECSYAVIDRNWGLGSDVSLMAIFPKLQDNEKLKNYTLKMRDFGLGNGSVLFPLHKLGSPRLNTKTYITLHMLKVRNIVKTLVENLNSCKYA